MFQNVIWNVFVLLFLTLFYMFKQIKLGILGGGQLGRMMIQAAIELDIYVGVLDPDPNAPCSFLAHEFTEGDFRDYETVLGFGRKFDTVTIEIEQVNVEALKKLQEEGIKVYPEPEVLEIIKDKRIQKQFFASNDLPTAAFILCHGREDIEEKISHYPVVNKIGVGGYDGKGVQILHTDNDLEKSFSEPSLLEEVVDFEKELAVIVARNSSGDVVTFPVVEMCFHPEKNVVEYLYSPANITEEISEKARIVAIDVIKKLEMTGLLAVEMFLTHEGEILINEIAPRPHNSGHHTLKTSPTSQFEQTLRAILGLPLGDTHSTYFGAMINILGAEDANGLAVYSGMEEILAIPGVSPYLYGKQMVKPFRKMGHVSIIDTNFEKLVEKVNFVQNTIKSINE